MYQVITRNVIRAALRWHNMPAVRLTLMHSERLISGVEMCTYEAAFSQDAAVKRVHDERKRPGGDDWRCFDDILKGCFASDITVFSSYTDNKSGILRYHLHCRLAPWELQSVKGDASNKRTAQQNVKKGVATTDHNRP